LAHRLGPHHEVGQFTVPADDQVEMHRRERQVGVIVDLDDAGTYVPQVSAGDLDVGRPGLGGH
jgi:hypothetical protein